jgi:hypothetical protein
MRSRMMGPGRHPAAAQVHLPGRRDGASRRGNLPDGGSGGTLGSGHSIVVSADGRGIAEGINAVITRAELIASYGVRFALQNVLVSRDNMALSLHNTARRGDVILDEYLATVCQIEEGKITAIETHLSDVEVMNAFFADLP